MGNLKHLDVNASHFFANGKKYIIESDLSIERFVEYQILEKEAGFGITFEDFFNNLENVYNSLNENKIADASVKLYNLMNGVADMKKREPMLLRMATLFINEESEDRATITADRMSAKIEDWKKEYFVESFFVLASNLVNGYANVYERVIHNISKKTPVKRGS